MIKKIVVWIVLFCLCFALIGCSMDKNKQANEEIYNSEGKVSIIEGVIFDVPAGWTFEKARMYDDSKLNKMSKTNSLDIFTEYAEKGHISFESYCGPIESAVEKMITVDGMIGGEIIKKNDNIEEVVIDGKKAIRMTVDFIQSGREKHLDYIVICEIDDLNHMFLESPIEFKERAHQDMDALIKSLKFTK